MKPTLGGAIFCYNAISQDYCLWETVGCLKSLCDEVVIVDAGSTDGTKEFCKRFEDEHTTVIYLSTSEWEKQKGRTKLSYFQNIAIGALTTDWVFLLQADEVIHQDSFPAIREAIEQNQEAFFVNRINLWGDSGHQLNVPQHRSPVGTKIIRLAKTKYRSFDDGENIDAYPSVDYFNKIRIYHTGFIRDKYKHIGKIKHVLTEVFEVEMDKKVEAMTDGFDPWQHFSKDDVIPISEELPVFIQTWAVTRDKINDHG